jgi:hypothetical protein
LKEGYHVIKTLRDIRPGQPFVMICKECVSNHHEDCPTPDCNCICRRDKVLLAHFGRTIDQK